MNPANDLSRSHRIVLHKALGIARDAFTKRRPDVARPSRRFRAEVSYDDRRYHLAASAVTARSDHGRVAAISNSKEFAIEVQPYNERHRTPLVRIVGRRPADIAAPLPDRDAIVSEIDRMILWSDVETDPLRYDRRVVMAAVLGAQLQAEGLTIGRIGRPLFIAPTPWSAGRIGVEETISFGLADAERRACSSFCDRNRELVAQAFDGRPTWEIRSETKESDGRLRMIVHMTAPVQFTVTPMDPMEAMRRIAA